MSTGNIKLIGGNDSGLMIPSPPIRGEHMRRDRSCSLDVVEVGKRGE